MLDMVTIDENGYYTTVYSARDSSPVGGGWVPGFSNFVGKDGLLYGVPFTNENEELVIPDMLRVEVGDGEYAYVSNEEMLAASLGYGSVEGADLSGDELLEAEVGALQEAFCDYYGVDLLDSDSASECLDEIRLENGFYLAMNTIEDAVGKEIVSSYMEGDLVGDGANKLQLRIAELDFEAGSGPSETVVSEEDFDAIYDLFLDKMAITLPIYDEMGALIPGGYKYVRI